MCSLNVHFLCLEKKREKGSVRCRESVVRKSIRTEYRPSSSLSTLPILYGIIVCFYSFNSFSIRLIVLLPNTTSARCFFTLKLTTTPLSSRFDIDRSGLKTRRFLIISTPKSISYGTVLAWDFE